MPLIYSKSYLQLLLVLFNSVNHNFENNDTTKNIYIYSFKSQSRQDDQLIKRVKSSHRYFRELIHFSKQIKMFTNNHYCRIIDKSHKETKNKF